MAKKTTTKKTTTKKTTAKKTTAKKSAPAKVTQIRVLGETVANAEAMQHDLEMKRFGKYKTQAGAMRRAQALAETMCKGEGQVGGFIIDHDGEFTAAEFIKPDPTVLPAPDEVKPFSFVTSQRLTELVRTRRENIAKNKLAKKERRGVANEIAKLQTTIDETIDSEAADGRGVKAKGKAEIPYSTEASRAITDAERSKKRLVEKHKGMTKKINARTKEIAKSRVQEEEVIVAAARGEDLFAKDGDA